MPRSGLRGCAVKRKRAKPRSRSIASTQRRFGPHQFDGSSLSSEPRQRPNAFPRSAFPSPRLPPVRAQGTDGGCGRGRRKTERYRASRLSRVQCFLSQCLEFGFSGLTLGGRAQSSHDHNRCAKPNDPWLKPRLHAWQLRQKRSRPNSLCRGRSCRRCHRKKASAIACSTQSGAAPLDRCPLPKSIL